IGLVVAAEPDAFDPTHALDGWHAPAPAPLDLNLKSLQHGGTGLDEAKMARLKARGYEMVDVEDVELSEAPLARALTELATEEAPLPASVEETLAPPEPLQAAVAEVPPPEPDKQQIVADTEPPAVASQAASPAGQVQEPLVEDTAPPEVPLPLASDAPA